MSRQLYGISIEYKTKIARHDHRSRSGRNFARGRPEKETISASLRAQQKRYIGGSPRAESYAPHARLQSEKFNEGEGIIFIAVPDDEVKNVVRVLSRRFDNFSRSIVFLYLRRTIITKPFPIKAERGGGRIISSSSDISKTGAAADRLKTFGSALKATASR